MAINVLDYAPREEFNTGLFVARYLQVWALVNLALMIAEPIFFHRLNLDLSPIVLFWLASLVKRRSRGARTFLLIAFSFAQCLCIILVVGAMTFGTAGLTVHIGRPIKSPTMWQVAAVAGGVSVFTGVPLLVLASKRARRQFANGRRF